MRQGTPAVGSSSTVGLWAALTGEGANDVLRAFIAMVGIKPVADQFLKVKSARAARSAASARC
jgi:hypothetical protein